MLRQGENTLNMTSLTPTVHFTKLKSMGEMMPRFVAK